jgi:hypothetical protein
MPGVGIRVGISPLRQLIASLTRANISDDIARLNQSGELLTEIEPVRE